MSKHNLLKDIVCKSNVCKRVIAGLFVLILICPVISLGSESVTTLADGRYSVSIRLWHATNNEASMGDAGIAKSGILTVKDGKARIEFELIPMNVNGIIGYLSQFNVMEDIKYNNYLYPESYTKVPATALSTYDIVDDYNSSTSKDDNCRGVAYPKKISMPVTVGQEFTWVQMYIPFMGSLGFGEQIAKLRIYYDSVKEIDPLQNSDLQELVDNNKKLSSENYTEASYQTFTSVMEDCKTLLKQGDATEKEIQQAYDSLVDAIRNLVRVKIELPEDDSPEDSSGSSGSSDSGSASSSGGSSNGTLNKDKLSNGRYQVNIALWHATSDKESMGNGAIVPTALIDVKNGKYTMTVATQEMTISSITASLVTLQIKQEDGTYVDATKSGDNFKFVLPSTDEYIDVKMDPQVEIMGDGLLDARLKIDWHTLKSVSSSTTIGSSTSSMATSKATTLKDKKTGIQVAAEANVLPSNTSLKVTAYTSGKTYENVQSILGKDISNVSLYRILLFDQSGNLVTPNGMVTVTMSIPNGIDADKMALSRLNLSSKTATKISGTVKSDTVSFLARELGLVAIYESDEASSSISGSTSSSSSNSSVSTGSSTSTTEESTTEEELEDTTEIISDANRNEVIKSEQAQGNSQVTNIYQSFSTLDKMQLVVAGVVSIVVILIVLGVFGAVTAYIVYKKLRED